MNIDQVEKVLLSGASPEQAKVLKMRGQFAKKFCAQKGWDINDLSIEQLLEIRKQPQWQNPSQHIEPYEISSRCPKCGCPLICNGNAVWCTYVGSRRHNESACDFYLDLRHNKSLHLTDSVAAEAEA